MRVLDTTPIDSYTIQNMGKRKTKAKRNKETAAASSDEEGATLDVSAKCKHVSRAVNLNSVKKGLTKQSEIGVCQMCEERKAGGLASASAVETEEKLRSGENEEEETEPSVYMCLYCGFQGCDRSSEKKHALGHYDTQRSSPHCMAVSLSTWQVWCYTCDDFIDVPAMGGRLEECVQYIRKQYNLSSVTSSSQPSSSSQQHWTEAAASVSTERRKSQDLSPSVKSVDSGENTGNKKGKQTSIVGTDYKCSKVKGLTNLGNTCFFNAVMQNIHQTHILEQQIREYGLKGKQITLLSCPVTDLPSAPPSRRGSRSDDVGLSDDDVDDDDKPDDDDDDDDDDECIDDKKERNTTRKLSSDKSESTRTVVETLCVVLGDAGAMTRSLLQFFDDMNAKDGNKQNIVRPSELFGHICQKAPRFKGFQQQDSHELLHYLFDGLKAEESKRVKAGILKAFNLSENVKPKDVPEHSKLKIKAYGPQTRHSFVDSVFGGFLINTVICEDCLTHHQIFESFLDISLPINDDKFVQKPLGSKKDVAYSQKTEPMVIQDSASKPSKNMTKKQMKSQRKKHKKQGKKTLELGTGSTGAPADDVNVETTEEGPSAVNQAVEEGELNEPKDDTTEADLNADKQSEISRGSDEAVNENTATERGRIEPGVDQRDSGSKDSRSRENSESASDADVEDNFDEIDVVNEKLVKNVKVSPASKRKPHSSDSEVFEDVKPLLQENVKKLENGYMSNEIENHLSTKVDDQLSTGMEKLQVHENFSSSDNTVVDVSGNGITAENSGAINGEFHSSNDSVADGENMADGSTVNKNRNLSGDANMTLSTDTDSGVTSLSNSSFSNHNPVTSNGPASVGDSSKLSAQPKKTFKLERSSKDVGKEEDFEEARRMSTTTLVPCIPPPAGDRSVSVSLHRFTAMELLYGENKFMCSTCNEGRDKNSEATRSNASKQTLIYCPPAVLTLHLKRFQQVGFTVRKDSRHISFPETLDIASFCSALAQNVPVGQKEVLYSLYGVVEHEGTMRGGHYTAYVKVRHPREDTARFLQTLCGGQMTLERQVDTLRAVRQHVGGQGEASAPSPSGLSTPSKWYNISDTHVREVSCENVYKCEAYILFYERIM